MRSEPAPVTSLELTFDGALDAAVRAEWEALRAAGFSSLAAHTAPSNRPHVTLWARLQVGPFAVDGLTGSLPLPVTLGAPLVFGTGDRRVLARSVVPSRGLVALHAAVHALGGPGEDLPHTADGQWLPHVTLARRIRVEQLPAALALLGDDLHGTITGLRRWDAAEKLVTELVGGGPQAVQT